MGDKIRIDIIQDKPYIPNMPKPGPKIRVNVALLLQRYGEGVRYYEMARELGCSIACITYHIRGAALRGEIEMRGHLRDRSEAHLRGMALLAQGWTQTQVAREVGVSRQRVHQWVRESGEKVCGPWEVWGKGDVGEGKR